MPTPARAVQFRTVDDIVEAYVNNNVPCFAVWSGKQLMFPHETDSVEEGSLFLSELLDKLQDSAAIYTLCTYKDVGDKGILSNTPFSSSFNFQLKRLRDDQGNYLQPAPSIGGVSYNELLSELRAIKLDNELIKQKLSEYEDEDEDEDDNSLGLLGKVLEHPAIAGIVKQLASSLIPTLAGKGAAAIEPQKNAVMNGVNDEARLVAAIDVLKGCDPQLVAHLEKLAQIAKADPASFKMFLSYLDGIG